MDFYSFHTLINRLAKDARVHPNTPVRVKFDFTDGDGVSGSDSEPLISVAVDGGAIVLSTSDEPFRA